MIPPCPYCRTRVEVAEDDAEATVEWTDASLPLWTGAVLLFGVGDVVTTVAGIAAYGAVETSPVVAPVLGEFGLFALVPLKLGFLVAAYAAYEVAPRPARVGIPLGLTLLGSAASAWNLLVVVALS